MYLVIYYLVLNVKIENTFFSNKNTQYSTMRGQEAKLPTLAPALLTIYNCIASAENRTQMQWLSIEVLLYFLYDII